jgi:ADP-ribosylglycohydrolase
MSAGTEPESLEVPAASALRSRFRGCLLGGALGDALGAGIEFLSLREIRRRHGTAGVTGLVPAYGRLGAITDDTQMTMFTAEGLIRAWVRCGSAGAGHPPAQVWHAYLRWLHTQGGRARSAAEEERSGNTQGVDELQSFSDHHCFPDGWLVRERFLRARRAPGNTCLEALRSGRMGSVEHPINGSKGCGGVMRAAPAGLVDGARCGDRFRAADGDVEEIFDLAADCAAITHGHPSGYLPAGVVAATIHGILRGLDLDAAVAAAGEILRRRPRHQETLAAVESARALARAGIPSAERLETLGRGFVGEEALALALACALAFRDEPRRALLAAVNHSGDSDSTGSICGQLLGALHGEPALPGEWLAELEGREAVERLADDLHDEVLGLRPDAGDLDRPPAPGWEEWSARYPGW